MNKKKVLFLFLGNRDIKLGLTVNEVSKPTDGKKMNFVFKL
jgi:hypothetical protein